MNAQMTGHAMERGDANRVAVLGAYGAVGRRLVTEAGGRGYRVTAVGRDCARLAVLGAPTRWVADVDDSDAMRRIAACHDVVVNASGAERPALAQQITEAGAAFVDISAESSYLEELAASQPSRPVLAGTGLAPGLTNLLADAAPGTTLSLASVLAAPPGVWAAHQLLSISSIEDELRAANIALTRTTREMYRRGSRQRTQ